jgi:precorrin-3B C17-methyltransferase
MNKIYVVGTGPGKKESMTLASIQAIEKCDVIVGYTTYMKQVAHLTEGKTLVQTGMHGEVERCKKAIELADSGQSVALVSGGDAGVYGMAGLVLEIVKAQKLSVEVEVIPGVTSATACAAILGAPLMHDFVTISLSNWLTEINMIERRIACAGMGDFVVVIYNPKSKARPDFIDKARQILLKYKDKDTPVGLVRNAYRDTQEVELTTLEKMCDSKINMNTTVVIGNQSTFIWNDKMITPRGYKV